MTNTPTYEDESIILLAGAPTRGMRLFSRVRTMFANGFCPTTEISKQTEPEEEDMDDESRTFENVGQTSGAPTVMGNIFSHTPTDYSMPQSVTINSSVEQSTTCNDVDVQIESTLSFGKIVLTSLFYLYILRALVYFHFDFDILDLFFFYFVKIRKIIDPYASSIITTQLLTVPPLFFIIKELQRQRKPPELIKDDSNFNFEDDVLSRKQNMSDLVLETDTNKNIEINVDLDEATRNLPDFSKWKYRPVFIQPAGDTICSGHNPNESLPIGVPFEFESSLFKGKALFRLRNGKSDEDPDRSKAYFDANESFKFQRQFVVQGQFKHRTKMSAVWLGDIYDKKFKMSPPPRLGKFISNLFTRFAPGIIIDFVSSRPKVLALLGSGSHSISIDKPGEEPDITSPILPEKTFLSSDEKSSKGRKESLGNPNIASNYEYDPDLVYTFHTADPVLDLAEYKLRLPILTMDFTRVLGDGQPMSLRAVADDGCSSFFFFRVWHERTLIKAGKQKH